MRRPLAFRRLVFGGCLLLSSGVAPSRLQAADPQPYEVVLNPSGDAALDTVARESATLLTLGDKAPVGGFALVQRATTDQGRFREAMNALGYHDGTAEATIAGRPLDDPALPALLDAAPAAPPVRVVFTLVPGPRYRLGQITVAPIPGGGPVPPAASDALNLRPGQDARAAEVLAARDRLLRAMREAGFPLAAVALPDAVVNRDTKTLDLAFAVETGPHADLGAIEFQGLRRTNEAYMRRRLTLRPGQPFQPSRIDEAQRDLSSLGIFSSVRILPGDTVGPDGTLPMTVDVVERPLRAVEFGASYSTDLGVGANIGWHHRNLFGQAEQLNLTGVVQLGGNAIRRPGYQFGAQFVKPDVLRRDQSLTVGLTALKQSLPAYDQIGVIERVGIDRKLSRRWSVQAGLLGEQERITQIGIRRDYQLVGVPLGVKYDGTDDLLDPVGGARATASVTPIKSLGGRGGVFVIAQLAGSAYFDLEGEGRGVLALRGLVGRVSGANVFDLPPDQRFYAGGNATVRGYRYQTVGPRFANNQPTGGTSVAAGTVEFRQRFLSNYGIVAFIDAGQVGAGGNPFSGGVQAGAGLGARYYTSIGPIRLDFAVPLNKPRGGDAFEVYIGIGQAF